MGNSATDYLESIVSNQGKTPLVNYNFMLRVEGFVDVPCRGVRVFSKENEFEYIQEGGLNDYVHMRRKPITKPFTFQVERYVGIEMMDPLSNGTEFIVPLILFVNRTPIKDWSSISPLNFSRVYTFTGCVVVSKEFGELSAERSGLLVETTTIAYRELVCVDNPLFNSSSISQWSFDKTAGVGGNYGTINDYKGKDGSKNTRAAYDNSAQNKNEQIKVGKKRHWQFIEHGKGTDTSYVPLAEQNFMGSIETPVNGDPRLVNQSSRSITTTKQDHIDSAKPRTWMMAGTGEDFPGANTGYRKLVDYKGKMLDGGATDKNRRVLNLTSMSDNQEESDLRRFQFYLDESEDETKYRDIRGVMTFKGPDGKKTVTKTNRFLGNLKKNRAERDGGQKAPSNDWNFSKAEDRKTPKYARVVSHQRSLEYSIQIGEEDRWQFAEDGHMGEYVPIGENYEGNEKRHVQIDRSTSKKDNKTKGDNERWQFAEDGKKGEYKDVADNYEGNKKHHVQPDWSTKNTKMTPGWDIENPKDNRHQAPKKKEERPKEDNEKEGNERRWQFNQDGEKGNYVDIGKDYEGNKKKNREEDWSTKNTEMKPGWDIENPDENMHQAPKRKYEPSQRESELKARLYPEFRSANHDNDGPKASEKQEESDKRRWKYLNDGDQGAYVPIGKDYLGNDQRNRKPDWSTKNTEMLPGWDIKNPDGKRHQADKRGHETTKKENEDMARLYPKKKSADHDNDGPSAQENQGKSDSRRWKYKKDGQKGAYEPIGNDYLGNDQRNRAEDWSTENSDMPPGWDINSPEGNRHQAPKTQDEPTMEESQAKARLYPDQKSADHKNDGPSMEEKQGQARIYPDEQSAAHRENGPEPEPRIYPEQKSADHKNDGPSMEEMKGKARTYPDTQSAAHREGVEEPEPRIYPEQKSADHKNDGPGVEEMKGKARTYPDTQSAAHREDGPEPDPRVFPDTKSADHKNDGPSMEEMKGKARIYPDTQSAAQREGGAEPDPRVFPDTKSADHKNDGPGMQEMQGKARTYPSTQSAAQREGGPGADPRVFPDTKSADHKNDGPSMEEMKGRAIGPAEIQKSKINKKDGRKYPKEKSARRNKEGKGDKSPRVYPGTKSANHDNDGDSKGSMESKSRKYPPTRSARAIAEFLNK